MAVPATASSGRADARRNVEALLDAAREVLAEDPRAGLHRIAERAGVHRATLHRHFPSRTDLIARLYAGYLDAVGEVVTGADPGAADVGAELERLTGEVYRENQRWRAFAWAPAFPPDHAGPRDRMIEVLERLFERARRERVVRGDLSVTELQIAWGAPIQYLSSRIADGSWTVERATDFTLRVLRPAVDAGAP